MQFKNLAVVAFTASALASPDVVERQASTSVDTVSIYSVLQTALPSSLIALALTNSAAASAAIASEFAEGSTPAWFNSLPSNIQTYFNPSTTDGPALSSAASSLGSLTSAASSLIASANSSLSAIASNATSLAGSNSTATSGSNSTSATSTSGSGSSSTLGGSTGSAGSGSGASSTGASSSSSSAGAAIPTAVIGSGIFGALGLVGMLAL